MKKCIIAPSILAADFAKLGQEIKAIENGGAGFLHFDVMDGHFVPNISFGLPVLKSIAKKHHLKNDVHIMISEPWKYAREFIKAGADYLTFHYEACKSDKQVFEIIDEIHEAGGKAGISIKPNTPVEKIYPFIYSLDMVLIMSVEPGFGGQEFMESELKKIKDLNDYMKSEGHHILIEVDGGINDKTGKACKDAGVDVIVAGSYIFGHDDIKERIDSLK